MTKNSILSKPAFSKGVFLRVMLLSLFSMLTLVFQASCSEAMMSITATHHAFITAEGGVTIKPLIAAQSQDGGIIIAGTAGGTAWAAKTDGDGKAIWQYVFQSGIHRFDPSYNGIVPMSDGTTYLCGYVPAPSGAYSPGLLTHLDRQGRVINEQLIIPQGRPERGIARFDACARFGDGIVLQGHVVDWSRGFSGQYVQNDLYWLLVLDGGEHQQWEKMIPEAPDLLGGLDFGPLLVAADSSLVFATNHSENTEVVRTDANGDVRDRKMFKGDFRIVQPISLDTELQIVGRFEADDPKVMSVVTLDSKLAEVSRKQRNTGFNTRVAYRMPDGSTVLFGSREHVFGETYTSQVVLLDPLLQDEQILDLPHNKLDSGSIWAGTPLGEKGQFVSARGLSVVPDLGGNASSGVPRGFTRGVEMDFMVIK